MATKAMNAVTAVSVAGSVGMSEEALSLLSARRFGAVSDVLWDTTGGLLGAVVLKYVLVEGPTVADEWTISGAVTG
jgi:VanZ family protein